MGTALQHDFGGSKKKSSMPFDVKYLPVKAVKLIKHFVYLVILTGLVSNIESLS